MGSSAATRNRHLSNYAFGIYQDLKSALAEFIAPRVGTGISSGQYKAFNDKNAFQAYETLRALGGENRLIEFEASDPFFNCKPRGLAIAIDDAERTKAGTEDAAQRALEEAKVKTLVSSTAVSHEKVVFDIANAITPVAGAGEWSNDAKDPIEEINTEIVDFVTRTGLLPNRMVIGFGAWNVICEHPLVKARLTGGEVAGLTLEKFRTLLRNPAIEIRIGIMSYDTVKFGKAANKQNIIGGNVHIFYGQNNPTQYDPSFMKTFMPFASAIESVFQFRDENRNSDMFKTNWEDDVKQVSTLLGSRIALS